MFPFILHHLNELCRHGHVLLQPLFVEVGKQGDIDKVDDLEFVDVPLPLAAQQRPDDGSLVVQGIPHALPCIWHFMRYLFDF